MELIGVDQNEPLETSNIHELDFSSFHVIKKKENQKKK